MRLLAGDIGGTKTLLRIVERRGTALTVLHEARFASRAFPQFDPLIARYLHEAGELAHGIACACLGIAGPVRHDPAGSRAEITNLPWRLDTQALGALTGIPRILLINDFEAIGHGVGHLSAAQLHSVQDVPAQPGGVRLIIGAGTGLGVALWLPDDKGGRVLPSQGGHAGFAPADAQQDALLEYLRPPLGRVSWEHVVSGPGLVRIHEFLHRRAGAGAERLAAIAASTDPAAAIAAAAADGDVLCRDAVALFSQLYGRVAGDLALVSLPAGGVYLAGGIAPKLLGAEFVGDFMAGFLDKGSMNALMPHFPVMVITDPEVGVIGAAVYAAQAAR